MDALTCLQKLNLVGTLACATVDGDGRPQVRSISAIHYEPDGMYFLTSRGKNFCQGLLARPAVQFLGLTRFNEMIRLSGDAIPVAEDEQRRWVDLIFDEQPLLENVYPGDTREICIIFAIRNATIEYFNLGVRPIFRETYTIGEACASPKGFFITDECIECGTCASVCPQQCIIEGSPYLIEQTHCLHCGNCYEHCPTKAIEHLDAGYNHEGQ